MHRTIGIILYVLDSGRTMGVYMFVSAEDKKNSTIFNFVGDINCNSDLTNNSLFPNLIRNFSTDINYKIIIDEKYFTKYGPIPLIIIK